MPEFVRVSIDAGLAHVTIDRPDVHNAFNEDVIEQLTATFTALGDDAAVRVVILRSNGPSFCAGADVRWMRRMVGYSFEENVADAATMARMLRSIRECPRPVIARIHGACIGGGVGLAAACDLGVAVESARFCLSEVRLGIIPAVISPYVIEKMGPGHARRYALTAERFDARRAERIGLISEACDGVEAMDAWIARTCERLSTNGPEALAACKHVLSAVEGMDWESVEAETTRAIAQRRVSPEGQEGLSAFLDKRQPGWMGQQGYGRATT